jgi:hypothetical protein
MRFRIKNLEIGIKNMNLKTARLTQAVFIISDKPPALAHECGSKRSRAELGVALVNSVPSDILKYRFRKHEVILSSS